MARAARATRVAEPVRPLNTPVGGGFVIREQDGVASALEALRESVTAEMEGREEEAAGFEIGWIRPGMSEAEKEQASREIARVLREG